MKKSLLALALTVALAATSQAYTLAKTDNASLSLGANLASINDFGYSHTWVGVQKDTPNKVEYEDRKANSKSLDYSSFERLRVTLSGSLKGENGWSASGQVRFQTGYTFSGARKFDANFDKSKFLSEADLKTEFDKAKFESSNEFGKPTLNRFVVKVGNDKFGSLQYARGAYSVTALYPPSVGAWNSVSASRFGLYTQSLTYAAPTFNNTSVVVSLTNGGKDNADYGVEGLVDYSNGNHDVTVVSAYTFGKGDRHLEAGYTYSNLGGVEGLNATVGAGVASSPDKFTNAVVFTGFNYTGFKYFQPYAGVLAKYVGDAKSSTQNVDTQYFAATDDASFDAEVKNKVNAVQSAFGFTGPTADKAKYAYRVTGSGASGNFSGKQYQALVGFQSDLFSYNGVSATFYLDYLFKFNDFAGVHKDDGFAYTLQKATKKEAADDVAKVKAATDLKWENVVSQKEVADGKAQAAAKEADKNVVKTKAVGFSNHEYTHGVSAVLSLSF